MIQPSEFSGSGDWTMWIRKFQHLAELYTWSNSEKLIWLESKLTDQAGRAFETLDESAKEDFSAVVDALMRRFEQEAKQQLFQEKLLAYERKEDKDWATVGEKLKELAFHEWAEGFALSRFLTLLERDMELEIGV